MGNKSRITVLQRIAALGKWRIAFLLFALAYAISLLLTVLVLPLNWDEIVHLNSALNINSGLIDRYLSAAFYPPLFDGAVAASFNIFGVGLLAARLVSVAFSVLTLWATFELASALFDEKTAFLSTLILGVIPGYFWLSRLALIEVALVFFIVLSLWLFIKWVKTQRNLYMLLCGVSIGLGVLTKYQAVIIAAIVLFSMLFMCRGKIKRAIGRFAILVAGAAAVVVPWVLVAFRVYGGKILSNWLYALEVGNPEKAVYSLRYPAPIYYFIEMVWPYSTFHPISVFIYALCIAGLVFLVWRHRDSDKLLLVWFVVIYVFFTLIGNKEWRYVFGLFPMLSIAAATLIVHLLGQLGGLAKLRPNRAKTAKAASITLIAVVAGASAYSIYDIYDANSYFNIYIPIEPATLYAQNHLKPNASLVAMAAFQYYSADMVRFYLAKNGDTTTQVYQYPPDPIDAFTPHFNITEFLTLCKQNHVQYVLAYEYGATKTYYNSTLNLQQIFQQMYLSGNFSTISAEATFGANPRRIFIVEFTG